MGQFYHFLVIFFFFTVFHHGEMFVQALNSDGVVCTEASIVSIRNICHRHCTDFSFHGSTGSVNTDIGIVTVVVLDLDQPFCVM